jgi:hypothetical protein
MRKIAASILGEYRHGVIDYSEAVYKLYRKFGYSLPESRRFLTTGVFT